MAKKTNFGPDFSPFGAKCDSKIFFFMSLPLLEVKHCCRLSLYVIPRKTNEPNLRKWPKTQFQDQFCPLWSKFRPQKFFSWILPLHVRHCFKLSLYAISRKTKEPNLRNWKKTLLLGLILAQIWATNFFFQKSDSVSHQKSWSAIIMYNIRKN